MNITLSVPDETVRLARKRAEALGKSVNQLVREYLDQLAGRPTNDEIADEFVRLSRLSHGDSKGWKFNREEIHERK
ncbi:MAG: ribbon-helix-helix protein, CopG family [Candidatus Solibacter sp.]